MRHDEQRWTRLQADVARMGVAQACKLHGVHRSTWYRRANGQNPSANRQHQIPALVDAILQITLERPSWGCDKIAYYLALSGIKASSPTVQKILIAHGFGKRMEREARAAAIDGDSASWPNRETRRISTSTP